MSKETPMQQLDSYLFDKYKELKKIDRPTDFTIGQLELISTLRLHLLDKIKDEKQLLIEAANKYKEAYLKGWHDRPM